MESKLYASSSSASVETQHDFIAKWKKIPFSVFFYFFSSQPHLLLRCSASSPSCSSCCLQPSSFLVCCPKQMLHRWPCSWAHPSCCPQRWDPSRGGAWTRACPWCPIGRGCGNSYLEQNVMQKKEGKKIVYQPKTSPPKKECIGAYLKPEFLFSIFAYPRSEFLFSIF